MLINKVESNTVVIIPVYNEEKSLPFVIKELPKEYLKKIVVVDNNSTDNSSKIAYDLDCDVIFEPKMGYGQACLTGIKEALKYQPKYIAFIDGDYSDSPAELNSLIEKIDSGFDMVIGSRTLGKAEKGSLLPQAIFGNWLATTLMSIFIGKYKFSDLGPFRIINTEKLLNLQMKDTNFGWTIEMQVKALLNNLKVSEVSVSYKKRIGQSKITGTINGTFKAGYKILYTLFKLWIESLIRKH